MVKRFFVITIGIMIISNINKNNDVHDSKRNYKPVLNNSPLSRSIYLYIHKYLFIYMHIFKKYIHTYI